MVLFTGNRCPSCGARCVLRSDGEKETEVCRGKETHTTREDFQSPESLKPWVDVLRANAFSVG
jgi:hypothetical protein